MFFLKLIAFSNRVFGQNTALNCSMLVDFKVKTNGPFPCKNSSFQEKTFKMSPSHAKTHPFKKKGF